MTFDGGVYLNSLQYTDDVNGGGNIVAIRFLGSDLATFADCGGFDPNGNVQTIAPQGETDPTPVFITWDQNYESVDALKVYTVDYSTVSP